MMVTIHLLVLMVPAFNPSFDVLLHCYGQLAASVTRFTMFLPSPAFDGRAARLTL